MQIRRAILTALPLALAACSLFTAGAANAQAYPSKQITVIVSFPPGGDTDALARVFAEKLALRVSQPVIVENKPGASGTIGNSFVAKAPADGYTLLFTPNTFSIAPLVLKAGAGAMYDPLNDFTPIILAGTQSLFLVANTSAGVSSVKDLVAAAKAGKVTSYGSPGSGSPMHVLGAMFNKSADIKLNQVPYRGSGPAVIDLVGGHIPFMYTTLGPVAQHIASGKLVNIGVADPQRSSLAPNVPTLQESGYKDADVGAWQGLMAPKGLPADVQRSLNAHFNEILKMPDVRAKMITLALVPAGGEPVELTKMNVEHNTRYGKAIKEHNIQAD